ncbi:MAG: histidinol dehydrogenase, partial [Candidatus Bathyarchaeia archaeon]
MRSIIKIWDASLGFPKWIERKKPLRESIQLEEEVSAIIEEVRARGDAALIEFTKKFDGVSLNAKNLKVNAEEIEEAYEKVSKEQVSAI